jgi:hypothetical protein
MSKPFRITNDALAITNDQAGEVSDDGVTIAVLRIHAGHGVNFMWMPFLFTNTEMPLPDTMRAELVALLRFHANKLESRDIDRRMKEIVAELEKGGDA